MMKTTTRAALACALATLAAPAATIHFDDLPLGPAGYWNGSDGSGGFSSGGATFHNSYNTTWGSWSGFAYSNHTDATTPGWDNQYAAFAGGGLQGSSNYAVGYSNPTVTFAAPVDLAGLGAWITNTTYAGLSMRDGDPFAKKFGGAGGSDPDWFLLTITGYSGENPTGSVGFYLADFRFADDSQDYILSDWAFADLSALGVVDEIRFALSSSDNGDFGMNTPGYFAMDGFLAVPEPSSALCLIAGLGLLARRRR